MKSDWQVKKLSDIVEFNPTERLSKGAIAKKIPMDMLQPFTKDIFQYELQPYTGGAKFRNGDTIMARITPCLENGKVSKVNILTKGEVGFGSTEYIVLRAIPNVSDPDFIYYLTISDFVRAPAIKSMVGSSGRQRVQQNVLETLKLPIPPYDEQKKIAAILSALDEKIAINRAINDNLMHVASSLFSKALEDNADTLIATPLGEIADVKGGKRLPKGVNLQSVPNSHPYIRVRDLTNTAIVHINDDFEYVDDDTQRGISRYIVATNDVLLSIVGTIGLVSIVHPSLDNANLTENCVKLTKLKGITPQYLFLYLRSSDGQHEIARSTVGAVQAKLPIKNIQAINVPVLTSTQGKNLCETLNPLFSNMESLVAEIYSLTRLKNTLLPKLLSGEIDVSEVEF